VHCCLPRPAQSCLQENAFNYDKGVLAEILEPIMGKGLIPADLDTLCTAACLTLHNPAGKRLQL
jgi:hypothetical protein